MWYLIIPPIVVVVSLLFVLWYLSLKGADPLVAAQASKLEEEAGQQVSFSRTKTFFLHLLEKMAYRFKVGSLKMHNKLHDVTQSLKEKQRSFQVKEETPTFSEDIAEPIVVKEAVQTADHMGNLSRFFKKEKKECILDGTSFVTETAVLESTLSTPIVRGRKEMIQTERVVHVSQVSTSEESIPVSRPMVSEEIVHPERTRKRMPANSFREEDLIARIAANPKDFTAYEGLGDYYLETNNIKDAKECYRQVLKLSPVQRMVKIKIRRLEKIFSQKAE